MCSTTPSARPRRRPSTPTSPTRTRASVASLSISPSPAQRRPPTSRPPPPRTPPTSPRGRRRTKLASTCPPAPSSILTSAPSPLPQEAPGTPPSFKRFVRPYFRAREKEAQDEGKSEWPIRREQIRFFRVIAANICISNSTMLSKAAHNSTALADPSLAADDDEDEP